MHSYRFFPSTHKEPIRTLLLDANVTGQLDSIMRRGSDYGNDIVRERMRGLAERLDPNVLIMPGLGAGESVVRRTGVKEVANYARRSRNAFAALAHGGRGVKSWLAGQVEEFEPGGETGLTEDEVIGHSKVLRDNFVMPSYAIVLKAYILYLQGGGAEASYRSLAAFAEELFGRGSREVILGALLLGGNSKGHEMAKGVTKLSKDRDLDARLDDLWGTCFDLTYSRVAVMPSLPEFNGAFEMPCVFVTEDKHLGNFLDLIEPVGATGLPRGGGVTADAVHLGDVLVRDMVRVVRDVTRRGNERALADTTNLDMIARIRRFKARRYVRELEGWLAEQA